MEERDWKNFKSLVMKAAGLDKEDVPESRKIRIENRLRELFPAIRNVPDNPTYASMILKAITDLNEETGSSEEAISNFMKTEYKTLPWAHSTILRHHLRNLCETGEIVITDEMLFMLPKDPAETNLTLDHSREQQHGKQVLSPKRNNAEKVHKLNKNWGMGVFQMEKEHHRPKIILKFKCPNLDKPDGSQGYEEQLGRGQRNKGKRRKSFFCLDQRSLECPTPRKQRSKRPARFINPTQRNEAFQFGGERKYTRFLLPHESNEDKPLETARISLPATRPQGKPPKCKLMNDGEPKFSATIPEGIIIALPAQPKKQVKLMRQSLKM
ncbi:uncharacterized protein LOC124909813 [Impatiens glandulifera]|uniref:uncharacterized protein LOC124909813 n=1 Tax=Impatiens glandulifera TaxID=253017 RepID=UPI001FB07466|nr:uncharacterized protein LOC124909813 [Impatiens glandulifera]